MHQLMQRLGIPVLKKHEALMSQNLYFSKRRPCLSLCIDDACGLLFPNSKFPFYKE
jgi:hypothetical protein